MYKVDQIVINPEVPEEIQKLSSDLVGYVLRKSDGKVVDTAVLKRKALPDWYAKRTKSFDPKDHLFCISATCSVGVILGMATSEVEEKKSGDKKDDSDAKGGKWNYHVN